MPRDGLPDENLSVGGSRLRLGLYAVALACGGGALVVLAATGGIVLAGTTGGRPPWSLAATALLLGLTGGVWLGGRLSGPLATLPVTLRRLAATFGAAALASVAAALLPAAMTEVLTGAGLNGEARQFTLAVLLLLPPALAAGAAVAVLLKLAVDERPLARGPALGSMLACAAGGGGLGLLLAETVLLPRMGPVGALTGAGVVFATLALVFAIAEPRPLGSGPGGSR